MDDGLFRLAFAGIGALTALRGVWSLVSAWLFERRAARVTAAVTDMRERYVWSSSGSGSSSSRVWVPVVRFVTGDGRTVESETEGHMRFKRVDAGDSLEVVYDGEDPTDVRLPTGIWTLVSTGLSVAVGLFFVWIGLSFF